MGYYQHKHASYADYAARDKFDKVYCSFCKEEMEDTTPTKKFHTYEENPQCYFERWENNLTLTGWIHRVCGMTVKEFIEQEGNEVYEYLKQPLNTL